MARTIAELQGPRLFGRFLRLNPAVFTPAHVRQLYTEISDGMAEALARINGPELRMADIQVLSEADYQKLLVGEDGGSASLASSRISNARCATRLRDGIMTSTIYFNIKALEQRAAAGQMTGVTIVHECSSMIYTPWLERRYAALGVKNTDNLQMMPETKVKLDSLNYAVFRLVEGWANYLANDPFPTNQLLLLDAALTTQRHKVTDPSLRKAMIEVINDPHSFGALALMRIEMAFGFDSLIPLMRSPMGMFEASMREEQVWGGEILNGLWQFYAMANNSLGLPPVPAETCINGKDINWTDS